MNGSSKVWGAILCLILGGCARPDVPEGLSEPSEVLRDSFGARVLVRLDSSTARGELLAVEPDTLFLLYGDRFRALGRKDAREVKVFLQEYPLSTGAVTSYTLLGTLSTISNGFGLVITAPLWLITGVATGIAASADANDGDYMYPDEPWLGLAKFARFPQGLPRTVPREKFASRR
jgi:hypothetical protein